MTQSGETAGIEVLHALNRVGDYREAIRAQMRLDGSSDVDESRSMIAEREVQLAVAMQHAGFYLLSYNAYLSAKTLGEAQGGIDLALRSRIDLQLAVLDERLGRLDQASSRLEGMKSVALAPGMNIAQMSDDDWYFVTRMKIDIARGDLAYARAHLKRADGKSPHHADWSRVFQAVISIKKRGLRTSDLDTIAAASESYLTYDAPGDPWIALFAGPIVATENPSAGVRMMEVAVQRAERMGKYFLVAALYEQLTVCYIRSGDRLEDAQLAFRRSLVAYGRCQLATHREIRSRMVKIGRDAGLHADQIADIAVRSSSLLLDRGDIRFGQLLAERSKRTGRPAHREFEGFVEEWAPLRFAGRLQTLDPGEPAADVLLVREVNGRQFGTAIQAKHYGRPRDSVPSRNPRLRELGERHGLTVDRYIFVVTTSSADGWQDSMWHSQTTASVRNVVADTDVDVLIVTEPELQTDVALNDQLLRWLMSN